MRTSGSLSRVSKKLFRLWFDELPDAAIEGILRFAGSNLQHNMHQLPSATALSLLRSRGNLSRVAQTSFSTVWYNLTGSEYSDERGLWVSLDDLGLSEFPRALGPNLHTLHIRAPFPFYKRDI